MSAPELAFAVEGASVEEPAAAPTLRLDVRVAGGPVRAIELTAQVRIAPARRRYDDGESERLAELFGAPAQWERSMRSMLWAHVHTTVGPFEDAIVVALPLPCTYDLEVAAAKYLRALDGGDVPLELLFGGTVFAPGSDGRLQITRVGADCEATFALPVTTWRAAMDRHFGDQTWLRLRHDAFDRLYAFRSRNRLGTWEATVDALLEGR